MSIKRAPLPARQSKCSSIADIGEYLQPGHCSVELNLSQFFQIEVRLSDQFRDRASTVDNKTRAALMVGVLHVLRHTEVVKNCGG